MKAFIFMPTCLSIRCLDIIDNWHLQKLGAADRDIGESPSSLAPGHSERKSVACL